MWRRPRRLVVYILAADAAAFVGAVASLVILPLHRSDLALGVPLLVGTVLYLEVTGPIERIRERVAGAPHIDLNSIWMFSATLLVHPALVAILVAVIYLYRWIRIRHHVVHRQAFSAACAIVSAYAAATVLALGNQLISHGDDGLGGYGFADMPRDTTSLLVVTASGLTFVAVNTVLICAAIAMTQQKPTLSSITADWEDYALELSTVGLAILMAWTLVDWRIVGAIVFGVCVVLHREVLFPQLRDAARKDQHTGLLNKRAWTSAARQEIAEASQTGRTVAILFVDLDHFKLVNDVHGHPFGDEVLLHVALAISGELRQSDLLGRSDDLAGRYGGEEFIILLPGASQDDGVKVGERIRQHIAGLALLTDADEVVTITTSIGVAVYPTHGRNLDQVVKAADRACYAAKRAGRNEVRLPPAGG